MKFKNILFTIIIAITVLACEGKIVEFDMPDDSSKLVVFGFLSPGDTVTRIYVDRLRPVTKESNYKQIDNAIVNIIHDNQKHILKYDTSSYCYSIDDSKLQIKKGETYSLEVSLSGCETASATISIIDNKNSSLMFDKFIKKTGEYEHEVNIAVEWKDNSTYKNYYVLDMDITDTSLHDNENNQYTYGHINNRRVFYDDANWNGEKKYSNDLYFWSYGDLDELKEKNIAICLINADEHYYMYHKKASEQGYSFDNPFAEPIIVYSNIENGAGVFCSYNKQIINVKWKE